MVMVQSEGDASAMPQADRAPGPGPPSQEGAQREGIVRMDPLPHPAAVRGVRSGGSRRTRADIDTETGSQT